MDSVSITSSETSSTCDSAYSEGTLETNSTKETLTRDQKRKNHIKSEQKRRNTIKQGFKELDSLLPLCSGTSKSMTLFKSVEYIKRLEKQNKRLRERLTQLQTQVQHKQKRKKQQFKYLREQVKIQQALLNMVYSPKALIIPSDNSAPCLHIPAD